MSYGYPSLEQVNLLIIGPYFLGYEVRGSILASNVAAEPRILTGETI